MADQDPFFEHAAVSIRYAGQLGILTNANVLPLTTTDGLLGLFDTFLSSATRDELRFQCRRLKKAAQGMIAGGRLTNTSVAAADTVEGLVTLGFTHAPGRNIAGKTQMWE